MKAKALNQQQNKSHSNTNLSSGWLQRAAVREVSEKEVKPSVVESGLNRSFVNVPVRGDGLPVVQQKLTVSAKNRTEATDQRKLQDIANNSPQAQLAAQLQLFADNHSAQKQQPSQEKASPERSQRENNTGLPDNLKAGVENLSGYSLDDVRVHYNSPKPAQLQALAYTQGTEIHVAPGQEKHLPHEAWHVVQQMQGRVKPTIQAQGVAMNDDRVLEREADRMGNKAITSGDDPGSEVMKALKEQPVDWFAEIHPVGRGASAVLQAIADRTLGTVTIKMATGITYEGGAAIMDHESAGRPTYIDGTDQKGWPTMIDVKPPPKGKGPISSVVFSAVRGSYTFSDPQYFNHGAWGGPRITEPG
jgi:hypothetical protein